MNPKGHTAVMARRAPVELELGGVGGDPNDYFPTPPWATRALLELLIELDPDLGSEICDEPACGGGHMAHPLREVFALVRCSDLIDRGAGEVRDFLGPDPAPDPAPAWVISNPPFSDGEAFVRRALERASVGVAMLLRLQFLEGAGRYRMFTQDCPLTIVAPFAERVPMVKGRWDPEASSATAYAWFIWVKDAAQAAPQVIWIAPGARERLTRQSDFDLFAPAEPSLTGDLFAELSE